jgi:hypothetical protein
MISRKQFFKALLYRGVRAINDPAGREEGCFSEHEQQDPEGCDLSFSELSPSLLAIEAERRGIDLQAGRAEELRREIYQELAQNGQGLGTSKP